MLLEAYQNICKKDTTMAMKQLQCANDTFVRLCSSADQSMQHADQHNLSSNALFVLREERELISQHDYLNDYIMNNAHCHFTPQPEDEKKKVEEP